MTPADVKQDPYNLPSGFEWCQLDMTESDTVEEVYKLLNQNYVEDDDNMFRCANEVVNCCGAQFFL